VGPESGLNPRYRFCETSPTREAVSKVISEFQRDGYIEVKNRKIVILDQRSLAGYGRALRPLRGWSANHLTYLRASSRPRPRANTHTAAAQATSASVCQSRLRTTSAAEIGAGKTRRSIT
jgi:hypothetical protein